MNYFEYPDKLIIKHPDNVKNKTLVKNELMKKKVSENLMDTLLQKFLDRDYSYPDQ